MRVHATTALAAWLVIAVATALGLASGAEVHGQLRQEPPLSLPGDGRSVLVYPAQTIALRMSHAHPAHAALACTRCHERAATSTRADELLLPREAACVPCHAETDRAQPSVERCAYCHVGARLPSAEASAPDAIGRIFIPASRTPSPRLRFSHATHATAEGGCEGCHAGTRTVGLATRAQLPTMRDCMRCHAIEGLAAPGQGTSPEAGSSLACTGCHESLPDGRVRANLPEGWMNPPPWMAGMRHDHEWLVRHRWIAADAGPLCAQCHVERECADCHDGRARSRRVHPGDFLTTHAVMARRDETRCTSCHAVGTFCSECHARLGLATFSAPVTRGGERYHPPSAVWIRGPNLHGVEARRSLQSCVSCHDEGDCVACHGTSGVGGGGVSPHPPGFADSCGALLGSSPAACIRCHGDAETLRTRCR
ncbi:MAG: hypothetical protein K1X94_21175 [Sandaracinaceae bacterium]|nr:hypothetical protein [Sandaracinaceae bacterium]